MGNTAPLFRWTLSWYLWPHCHSSPCPLRLSSPDMGYVIRNLASNYQGIINSERSYKIQCTNTCTRGIQKVRRLTQLTTRYADHILSLFNIVSCKWNELGPTFLQSSDSNIEELLFFVFQPAICHAIRIRMANTVGNWVVQSWHFGWQPVLELTCDQLCCPGSKWLLFVC